MEVVDKIANATTNAMDQPEDPNAARITKITIE
jgi:dolichyl-diphosphooligosaccharide--protein glycosyltransferase